ncbi:uncharacterized protein BROUX77_003766 [Berkeleyomyces rouxiae]|uniref:uncharacterized protein n=1 Tax=Berkeleyomyces rouxiae TaxID=2035830 RepID=UPI003B7AEE67
MSRVATHDRGHTLDLVIANSPGAWADIPSGLDTTSDHSTLFSKFLFGPQPALPAAPGLHPRSFPVQEAQRDVRVLSAGRAPTGGLPGRPEYAGQGSAVTLKEKTSLLKHHLLKKGNTSRNINTHSYLTPIINTRQDYQKFITALAAVARDARIWEYITPESDRVPWLTLPAEPIEENIAHLPVVPYPVYPAGTNIQGVSDAVLPGRLQCRLREQGWPATLMRWVGSFMDGRKGHIRLASHRTPDRHLSCEVLQGSPISPILFMLFLQPMFDSRRKFGYADNVAIVARGKTPDEATRAVEMDLGKMAEWTSDNGLRFAPHKTEVIHSTQSSRHSHPPVQMGGTTITPRKSGLKAAHFLRSLSNTTQGLPAEMARLAVKGCVIPLIFYGYGAYWPVSNFARGDRLVSTGSKKRVETLDKALRVAMRSILSVWKTFPTAAFH